MTVENHRILLQKNADLEAQAVVHAEWMSTFHHEFRSQLHMILGYSKLIPTRSKLISKQEISSVIARSVARLVTMVDESMGRVSEQTSDLAWDTFMLQFFLAAQESGKQCGNVVSLSALVGVPPSGFMVNHFKLQQMLRHLLYSINQYRSGADIAIGMTVDCLPLTCVLSIDMSNISARACDDTAWIPVGTAHSEAAMQTKYFQECVFSHGGTLLLETNGNDAHRIRLKLLLPISEKVVQTRSTRATLGRKNSAIGRVILVVEDVEVNIFLLQSLLLDAGFSVLLARSGDDAKKYMDQAIDLVITDQFMGRGNGWDVLFASKKAKPARPVILLSGAAASRPEGIPEHWNFSATIQKPVDHQYILKMIGDILSLDLNFSPVFSRQLPVAALPASIKKINNVQVAMELKIELARLTDLGLVTDILVWGDNLKKHSDSACEMRFAESVIAAAGKLDFAGLVRLSST